MRRVLLLLVIAGCPKPPPPPSVTEPPRLAAEESCTTPTPLPTLPPKPAADPFRLTHPAAMYVIGDRGEAVPATFVCDLPDTILGIAATQTVDGGKRVVGGAIYATSRVSGKQNLAIDASSPGCKEGELACTFATSSPSLPKLDMLRDQWIHTSGWVHGHDDLCRALPDDTIAVCSTLTHMVYVELGCDGELHLGVHNRELARRFDLDVESPVLRLRGALDPVTSSTWRFQFRVDEKSSASPRNFGSTTATLEITLPDAGGTGAFARLAVDGHREPCLAWAIYRR